MSFCWPKKKSENLLSQTFFLAKQILIGQTNFWANFFVCSQFLFSQKKMLAKKKCLANMLRFGQKKLVAKQTLAKHFFASQFFV